MLSKPVASSTFVSLGHQPHARQSQQSTAVCFHAPGTLRPRGVPEACPQNTFGKRPAGFRCQEGLGRASASRVWNSVGNRRRHAKKQPARGSEAAAQPQPHLVIFRCRRVPKGCAMLANPTCLCVQFSRGWYCFASLTCSRPQACRRRLAYTTTAWQYWKTTSLKQEPRTVSKKPCMLWGIAVPCKSKMPQIDDKSPAATDSRCHWPSTSKSTRRQLARLHAFPPAYSVCAPSSFGRRQQATCSAPSKKPVSARVAREAHASVWTHRRCLCLPSVLH